MMERLTFEGNFCDIAQCAEIPGGSFCESGSCSQKKTWERLKAYEDTGLTPEEIDMDHEAAENLRRLCQLCDLDRLEELAKADVAPVRHGTWKYYHKQNIAVCTACSFERKLDDDFGRAVACPNCGALKEGK